MECPHCKGRLVKGAAPFSIDRDGYHLHWDAIPAWTCTQCGEPLFEGREVDAIQDAIRALDRENENFLPALELVPVRNVWRCRRQVEMSCATT